MKRTAKKRGKSPLETEIIKLHNQGLSRKAIAQQLGITEWKVRTTVRGTVPENLILGPRTGKLRVDPAVRSSLKPIKALILSDIHIPYHDPKSLGIALAFCKDYKPDEVILNGDIIDFYSVSNYVQDPARIHSLQDEINETVQFIKHIKSVIPKKSKIIYLVGNHEDRLRRFLLTKAPDLSTLDCLTLEDLLCLKELEIPLLDDHISLGDLDILHGAMVRRYSGWSVKAHMEKLGGSVLIGHCHRLGAYFMKNKWGTHVGLENGCLCSLSLEYVKLPANWQHGFTTVEYLPNGEFSFTQHHIMDYKLIYNGIVYGA